MGSEYAGRIAIYDYYIPTMEMVALGMGIRPDTITKDNLPQIRDKLLEMKKLASVVGDVPTVQNALITGAADIIVAGGEYSVVNLMKENPALDWVLPDGAASSGCSRSPCSPPAPSRSWRPSS